MDKLKKKLYDLSQNPIAVLIFFYILVGLVPV